MGAAAALTLAAIYGATSLFERRLTANLLFCLSALATAASARGELGMMHADTPAELGEWMRFYLVTIFFVIVFTLLFVRSFLGTGRNRLLGSAVAARGVLLIANFFLHPNSLFREISSVQHVEFLGEKVSLVGDAVPSGWAWFGRASLILAFWFVIDASIERWRRGDAESRRKALVVLAALVGPGLISLVLTQMVLLGVKSFPYLDTPAFLVTLAVMAVELSREIMMSSRTQLELAALRASLVQVGRVSMMGQLASAIAHEINQPLGAILRNTDVAELDLQSEKPDLEELRGIVADTGKAVRRAKEIIDRLRTLIKRRSVELQPVAVEELMRDVIVLARAEAAAKEVSLSCAVQGEIPPVSADRVHISQVLLNLVVNGLEAVQACPVGERRVVIEARAERGQVAMTVRDSGPGIPASDIGRIFEPLFSTKPDGLGMGLAISRTIIEAHGGRLLAENIPLGGGAAFRFVLAQANKTMS
jgi:signal transduction histidine kinase